MSMDMELAHLYNTHGVAEDQEKVAELELFAKVAADHDVDLSQMSDHEIDALYAEVTGGGSLKLASSDEDDDEDDDEDEEKKAFAYFAAQREQQEKVAEADYMGRVMAHAYVNELDSIKLAGGMDGKVEKLPGATNRRKLPREERLQMIRSRNAAENAAMITPDSVPAERGTGMMRSTGGQAFRNVFSRGPKGRMARKAIRDASKHRVSEAGKTFMKHRGKAGLGLAGIAAATGYAAAAGKNKESAANFEYLAMESAVKTAAAAGYDVDEAVSLVNAVGTLGLGESEKVAYVQDFDTALHVRGLEYLETAGYPVNWDEIYG